jgi:glycosyltransferase involved in cell wall biosynthesis
MRLARENQTGRPIKPVSYMSKITNKDAIAPPGNHLTRALILSPEAFNKITGAGITFSNLFAGWPRDAIAVIHDDALPLSDNVCARFYRLTRREVHWWGWLRYIQTVDLFCVAAEERAARKQDGRTHRALKRIKALLFGDGVPQQTHLTPELEAWITEFSPTVLYTTLGSNAMMELVERLRVRFRLPLVIHIMDDWVSVLYRSGFLSHLQNTRKKRLFQHLTEIATARFAVCDEMSEVYRQRYGQIFQSFQNTIDIDAWQQFRKNPVVVGSPVRVAYIGSVFPNAQLTSLRDICNAVQELNDERFSITFEIYSPRHLAEQYREQLVVGTAISLYDTISDDISFFSTLKAVDILVLPVNFDRDTIELIRYSMPTKVPAYLTVGTPILAYGPADVAQIAYARKSGWAITVTVPDREQLKHGLRTLATDMAVRERISGCARAAAAEKFDAKHVRTGFQSAIALASGHSTASTYAE